MPDKIANIDLIKGINAKTNKRLSIEYDRFMEEIEKLTGHRVVSFKRGRIMLVCKKKLDLILSCT